MRGPAQGREADRSEQYLKGMWFGGVVAVAYDRVSERRRAVALARHVREVEGLSIAQIADRLGPSPAMVRPYFYDPTGEKARAVKARHPARSSDGGRDSV